MVFHTKRKILWLIFPDQSLVLGFRNLKRNEEKRKFRSIYNALKLKGFDPEG